MFIRFGTFSGYISPQHPISNLKRISKNRFGYSGPVSSGALTGFIPLTFPFLVTFILMLTMHAC